MSPRDPRFGAFSREPVVQFLDDARRGRCVQIVVRFCFLSAADGEVWPAEAGLICDGASIPRVLWPLVGGPYEGAHRDAALIHDAAYARRDLRGRAAADRAFYLAMRASRVPWWRARAMWAAVRLGGGGAWREKARAA